MSARVSRSGRVVRHARNAPRSPDRPASQRQVTAAEPVQAHRGQATVRAPAFAYDDAARERLWEASQAATGDPSGPGDRQALRLALRRDRIKLPAWTLGTACWSPTSPPWWPGRARTATPCGTPSN
ncbi:hypothetical protein [Spongiactinospora gelatinilytica]|uniref:hypothetical protein n=1 Tax=Spongiactinospora gelatinilytica TaxID=2666298 RepID=UPI001314AD59|nr:hypothetical protein [Spongiactinospora gelatinilytica]